MMGRIIYRELTSTKIINLAHSQTAHQTSELVWNMVDDLLWDVVFNRISSMVDWRIFETMDDRYGNR